MTELLPAAFFTVRITAYFPVGVYLCTGFLAVEVLLSPKFQDQAVGLLVLLSMNVTVRGAFPVVRVALKDAIGEIEHLCNLILL